MNNASLDKERFALSTRSGKQFNMPHIDKQKELLDHVANDPMRAEFESILDERQHLGKKRSVKEIFESACAIAATAKLTDNNLVMFSSTDTNRKHAENHVYEHPDCDVIHTTPAGWFLERLELFNEDVCGLDYELAMIPWYIATIRFISENSSSATTAFIDKAKDVSTFRMIEIPALMANTKIQTINKNPKHTLASEHRSYFIDWVREIEQSRSAQDIHNSSVPLSKTFKKKAHNSSVRIDDDLKHDLRKFAVDIYIRPLMTKYNISAP